EPGLCGSTREPSRYGPRAGEGSGGRIDTGRGIPPMSISIRPYRPEDEAQWLRVHAIIMSISHAWNYCIQERPAYEGHVSTRLVAVDGDRIIGLTDVQYENEPGELCF